MATAKLTYPFKAIHGQLKASDRFYCRMLYGRCILQRKPRRSTPAQRAMRRAFAQRYQGAHYESNPVPSP